MAEKEYIEKEAAIKLLYDNIHLPIDSGTARAHWTRVVEIKDALIRHIKTIPAADVVEVVRCKDCKYFVPKHIRMEDGSTREYTEEEKKLPFGVPGDVGINCGSICMLRDYWAENRFPVYVNENDFCSYGERKEETP